MKHTTSLFKGRETTERATSLFPVVLCTTSTAVLLGVVLPHSPSQPSSVYSQQCVCLKSKTVIISFV